MVKRATNVTTKMRMKKAGHCRLLQSLPLWVECVAMLLQNGEEF